jgi:flagellar protein FliO/FliZ
VIPPHVKPIAAKLLTAASVLVPVIAAAAEAPRRFAAPEVASAPAASGATGVGQVMLALVVVLAAVFVAAVLLKRLRGFTGGGSDGIEVLAQASVGTKEKVVIIRVAGNRLLLGVASGQVSLLQTLPAGEAPAAIEPAAPQAGMPRFGELLRRSLGR